MKNKALVKKAVIIGVFLLCSYPFMVMAEGTYRITIQNLTSGQPLSPAVGATHDPQISMFMMGENASPGLEAIAEDGNQELMFNRFLGMVPDMVTGVFGMPPGMPPIAPGGDALTRTLMADSGDRFSMATMLICTNDGFTGVDRATLPEAGGKVILLRGYDSGTEDNTERNKDIVDACGALGPVPLMDGRNKNFAVDANPQLPIGAHPVIRGTAGLTEDHRWVGPVAKVTINRVAEDADRFLARLGGAGEVPPLMTDATGRATFELNEAGTELAYSLVLHDVSNVVQAHIHMGLPNENGPVVAFLFGPEAPPTGPVTGELATGVLDVTALTGAFAGDFAGFVDALRNGELYVNVHTTQNASGEVRGQIGVVVDMDSP